MSELVLKKQRVSVDGASIATNTQPEAKPNLNHKTNKPPTVVVYKTDVYNTDVYKTDLKSLSARPKPLDGQAAAAAAAAAGSGAAGAAGTAMENKDEKKSEKSRYETTLDGLKSKLEKYGVAVIPNVLNAVECQHMVDGMWSYLEHVSQKFEVPIRRTDCKTWAQIQHLWPMHWMLLKQYGIGQTQMSWDLRQNPKVAAPFAKLWDTKAEDLLCSFDGASFQMPPEITGHGWNNQRCGGTRTKVCFVMDSSAFKGGSRHLTPPRVTRLSASWNKVTNYTPNLIHISKSRKSRPKSTRKSGKRPVAALKKDWFKLEPKHVEWYQKTKGCKPVYIQCPAGSMVFWDSRTIHYGREAVQGRAAANRIRCIAYICMTPRRLCSEANRRKRVKAFNDMRTTSHWPHKPKTNPTAPRTYGKPTKQITDLPKPILTPLGKSLVGL